MIRDKINGGVAWNGGLLALWMFTIVPIAALYVVVVNEVLVEHVPQQLPELWMYWHHLAFILAVMGPAWHLCWKLVNSYGGDDVATAMHGGNNDAE